MQTTIQKARSYAAANVPQPVEIVSQRLHPAGMVVVTVRDTTTGATWETPASAWRMAR